MLTGCPGGSERAALGATPRNGPGVAPSDHSGASEDSLLPHATRLGGIPVVARLHMVTHEIRESHNTYSALFAFRTFPAGSTCGATG